VLQTALIVFIDSYPFYRLPGSRLHQYFPRVAALRPGLGYSVNCQAELFTGRKPDTLGYWCEYTYDPSKSPFRKAVLALNLCQKLGAARFIRRGLHRLIDTVSKTSTKDIPFALLPLFAPWAVDVFDDRYPFSSILKHPAVRKLSHMQHRAHTVAQTDEELWLAAMAHVRARRPETPVLALAELDHAAHWHGVNDARYHEVKDKIDARVVRLVEEVRRRLPGRPIFVLSDHGMVDVRVTLKAEMERHFGRPRSGRYVYFLEGTILRVWTSEQHLRGAIGECLSKMPHVEVLDAAERNRLGISRPEFADIVATTEEGAMWVPSFWGDKPSKAMHGYHPRYDTQLGVLLTDASIDLPPEMETREVAPLLWSALKTDRWGNENRC
jgi:hypothetical protein